MAGEVTLLDALERAESTSISDRKQGLLDLKNVLRTSRNNFQTLTDDAVHHIYEVLFRIAVKEQAAYLKSATTTTRTAAENRLSACSGALRLAVELGSRYVKLKTFESVIDHVSQSLRLPSGTFCEPIAIDYAKCLRSLLSYQPHVEHLRQDDRERIASFCIDCIKVAESELTEDDFTPGAEATSTSVINYGVSHRSSRSHLKDSGGSQSSRSSAKQVAEEMITCLSLLTSAPNATPGRKAPELLVVLVGFLQSNTTGGRSHQDAFAAINHVLAWIRTEDTQLARKYTSPLVRLIRHYWATKPSTELKAQILTTWIYLGPFLSSAMSHNDGMTLRSELIGLLEIMRNEYSARRERDLLLLNDLALEFHDSSFTRLNEISTAIFRLRSGKAVAEANWTVVHTLGTLCCLLSSQNEDSTHSEDEDQDEEINTRPRKRQRLTNEFDDLLSSSSGGSTARRVCALQTLAFLAQQKSFAGKQLAKAIDALSVSCADDSATVSSWAFLALASFASQFRSAEPLLSARWASTWQIASRAISNTSTCRAACHLTCIMLRLRLVPQHQISELLQTMTNSIDLNGPSVLADSVAHLLNSIIAISQQINPASSTVAAESILSWLFRIFQPSKFEDKEYASQHITFESGHVIELVTSCLAQLPHDDKWSQYPTWDSVGQIWVKCTQEKQLVDYLLLLPESSTVIHSELGSHRQGSTIVIQSRATCESLVLNHLIGEMYRTLEGWKRVVREKPRAISVDVFTSFCKSCMIASCIAFCNSFRDSRRQSQLQRQVNELLRTVEEFTASSNCSQEQVDAMLTIFSAACTGLTHGTSRPGCNKCELQICRTISKGMAARRDNRNVIGFDEDDDDMDVDSAQESQESRVTNQLEIKYDLKNEYDLKFSNIALQASVTTYATIVTMRNNAETDVGQDTSAKIVDYILSLPEMSIFASSGVLCSLLHVNVELTASDSYRLLDELANRTIESDADDYVFERSEVCLLAILDLMSSLTPVSTDKTNEGLYNLGVDMYNWFTSVALRSGILPPSVQSRVARLLLQLCHVDTDYGRDDEHKIPSVRTSLFKLVQSGSIGVQFFLASRISTIFELYVLNNHSAMFQDLQDSLPADPERIEGMAVRLLFLTKLASAWHSLLRECVYYMFETAGRVVSSAQHASYNVSELAVSLKFQTPKKLFRLFAAQLLHTWLETNSIKDLPYAIFQYRSLRELLEENQHEVTAQLLVWENEQGMQTVLESLNTTKKDLVAHCFSKCIAYSICRDISRPPTDPNGVTCESRLRNLIGSKEDYRSLVASRFATIVGQVYLSSTQDDVHDAWLDKRPGYGAAAKALADMKNFSHSGKALPTSQQPYFKSKFLYDEVERISRRTARNPNNPWDAPSFSITLRILFDSIEHALGPLHTCLVIRKIRWLICTASDIPLVGLPLEMLIHTLRPFLNDSQCADDVIGIIHYLLHRGQSQFSANKAFFYGTAMLMILQMRRHSTTKLDSTTQESQHNSTVEKMRKFQDWLVGYLQRCQSSENTAETVFYSQITSALGNVALPGNARQKSPESTLLLLLLEQYDTEQAFLGVSDRREALVLLSDRFEAPASAVEDCLALDEDCVKFAEPLWHVIQTDGLSEAFITWAATVIGRAYASSGMRPSPSTGRGPRRVSLPSPRDNGIEKSLATIAQRLSDLLSSRSRSEASLADHTLRKILTSFRVAEDAVAFEQLLPPTIIPAIQHGTQDYMGVFAQKKSLEATKPHALRRLLEATSHSDLEDWAQSISLLLCQNASKTDVLPALTVALENSQPLALELLPCIVHILLVQELASEKVLRSELSTSLASHFGDSTNALKRKQRYLINLLLYLRSRPYPGERTEADRLSWLEIDWLVASKVAMKCNMPTAALLFAESVTPPSHGSRRSSSRASMSQTSTAQPPQDLLLAIFENIEEPDSFYGVSQPATLDSILGRLDYEENGFKSLMFRSAQTDTHLRLTHKLARADGAGLVRSLSTLNLNSLTFALLSGGFDLEGSSEEFLNSARRLQQWDITPPVSTAGAASNCFAAFQELSRANDHAELLEKLRSVVLKHVRPVASPERPSAVSHDWFSALASLTEIVELISASDADAAQSSWTRMQNREAWMAMGSYQIVNMILSNRNTLFSVIAQNKHLLTAMRVELKELRMIELKSLFSTSKFARAHGQLQDALAAVSHCNNLVKDGEDVVLRAEAASQIETASVLWDLGEVTASVKILRETCAMADLEHQDHPIGHSGLLAQLAHQLSEARLEKPDDILESYLKPAIAQLHGRGQGHEAGEVFYEFAAFCDKQLQNPDSIEDFNRIAKLRQRKLEEVEELQRLSKRPRKSGDDDSKAMDKAKKWFEYDDADYKRVKANRDTFMQQSLQNYLRTLRASDEHDISVLRFFALWLENADGESANEIVTKFLPRVPSWKFVVLMNQIMSRLEKDNSAFQDSLKTLAMRICSEHPFHSLHHLYATTGATNKHASNGDTRETSVAKGIQQKLQNSPKVGKLLRRIFEANALYHSLALARPESQLAKLNVRDVPEAYQTIKKVPSLDVPPPTISVALRPDGNYDDVPTVKQFEYSVRIMGGQSAPKKLTAITSDGKPYMQLFKSGDDLRQDAIMEQVFEEVSKMLRNHKTTRHRGLHVRTYKVIPLSSKTGIIEFVPNSIAFGDFLASAHERYYPQDYKGRHAREKINALQKGGHSDATRIKEFERICERMHPVMRHFFFERFKDPDEWFQKRTAYTRTTASISILGYVLGLGDRHCQNIMLDERTGEVVHIDLGIAFEAGKVLPVPELVPFRLTRDVVDGMGINKTEGAFRRCCEFTMDALREDKDSIMTLLNVLRYDPLHSWTVSPLRAKRMQEETGRNIVDGEAPEDSSKKKGQDAGEADRALSIVENKLSKTLSTSAAVNELLQQATDVENLAKLFAGWSAYY